MSRVLVLRPEPGAAATAARALSLGLDPVVAPLFTVRSLPWTPPDGPFDALVLTSANAVRHAGMTSLAPFAKLPCYAVGEATAEAARAAGIGDIRIGPSDGAALAQQMAADGIARAVHPCGADHVPLSTADLKVIDVPVYAAEPVEALPETAAEALRAGGAVALLHSPRAAALFARLAAPYAARTRIAAISANARAAAGAGWAAAAVAARPRDDALLELGAKLCQTAPSR